MRHQCLLLAVAFASCNAFGQSTVERGRVIDDVWLKNSAMTAASNPSLTVSKTASVVGEDVCGAVLIKNTGRQPVTVSGIADSLEVHFPGSTTVPAPGSTPNWFKVADVPLAAPGPIAPGQTATINYCFSLCMTADYAGANSMRNVVTVAVAGSIKTFTTRSTSFPPPALDCQACCLADGSCRDTITANCVSAGGAPNGADTACATTECTQACCLDGGSCIDESLEECRLDEGEALGPGTECATSECPAGCCYSDGACQDQPPSECVAAGGRPHEPGSRCRDTLGCTLACCRADGTCDDVVPPFCLPPNNIRLGPGTECATSECPAGCCYSDGACQDQPPSECVAAGGRPHDPGSTCADTLGCTLACCRVDGTCDDAVPPFCLPPNTRLGPGSQCATSECPQPCCFNDGSCSDLGRGTCLTSGGHPLRPELTPTSCEQLDVVGGCPQACCFGGGHCETIVPLECSLRGGTLQGPGTNCGGLGCPRGCCHDDGSCSEVPVSACFELGGRPQSVHDDDGGHIGLSCDEVADRGGCELPCCFAQPTQNYCNTIPPDECRAAGGFPRPASLSCGTPDLCDGACCIGGGCEVMGVQDCTEQGGDPQSPGTDCGFGPISPCSVISP